MQMPFARSTLQSSRSVISRCVLPVSLAIVVMNSGAKSQDSVRFVWQKIQSRGVVETYRLELDGSGKGRFLFKRKDAENVETNFQLQSAAVSSLQTLFVQADFLNEGKDFVSQRKVADMGMKTILFEVGSRKREVSFNYSEDRVVQQIVTFFENLCQQEQNLLEIELALKYDRLGIPKKLDELEKNLSAKRIVSPERFQVVLDRIYKDESMMHYARVEAKKLLVKIQKMPPFEVRP
jgi:hypothetical protein